ncbi:MAG: sulfite exporter TauE/SafE family protein [Hyphomicrobium sp.]|nr:sulfite exporter TauE/SafE family protein [Hyphomicrobium sp.]
MLSTHKTYDVRRPIFASFAGFLIGLLGGLIGLGGAEFRLPVLLTVFALLAHRAVRFNLLVSLVTLVFAALTRLGVETEFDPTQYVHVTLSMIAGGTLAAWIGAGVLSRIPQRQLMLAICLLLILISLVLMAEAFMTTGVSVALSPEPSVRIVAGLMAGIFVGAVSSALGVAGGEFIIPILILLFGADVKTAGTLSLFISLPIVLVGVARHVLNGHYRSRDVLVHLVLPMSVGSVAGAIVGGLLSSVAPIELLKAVLAIVLASSAVKLWMKNRSDVPSRHSGQTRRGPDPNSPT